jgi:hypothetical protein
MLLLATCAAGVAMTALWVAGFSRNTYLGLTLHGSQQTQRSGRAVVIASTGGDLIVTYDFDRPEDREILAPTRPGQSWFWPIMKVSVRPRAFLLSYPGTQGIHFSPAYFMQVDYSWRWWRFGIMRQSFLGTGYGPTIATAPLWTVLICIWTYPAVRLIQWTCSRRRRIAGRCPGCGYDLRATPDRCPECGRAVERPFPAEVGSLQSPASEVTHGQIEEK